MAVAELLLKDSDHLISGKLIDLIKSATKPREALVCVFPPPNTVEEDSSNVFVVFLGALFDLDGRVAF